MKKTATPQVIMPMRRAWYTVSACMSFCKGVSAYLDLEYHQALDRIGVADLSQIST